jgi:hypothetical protein
LSIWSLLVVLGVDTTLAVAVVLEVFVPAQVFQ